jgi:hypothetical protein
MKSTYAAAVLAVALPIACHSSPPAEPSGAPAMSAPAPAESAAPAEAPSAAEPTTSAAPEASSAAPPSEPAPVASAAPPAPSASEKGASASTKKPAPAHAEAAPAAPAADTGYTGEDACTTKNFHYGAIKAACHTGGRKAAKGVMKGVVQKARTGGADLQCTSCHVDMSSFQLKPNAVGDLKKWL